MKTHLKRILTLALCTALLSALLPAALAWERKGEYEEGLALAADGSKWGYVNGAGSLTIPLRFSQAEPFTLGVARVTENGKQGLLRQDGTFLLEPVYHSLRSIGCGLYVGEKDGAWKLLSLTQVPPNGRAPGVTETNQFYPDASSITEEAGENGAELVLRWAESGEEVRIPMSDLPQFLREHFVPGWAFPLVTGRQAAFPDVSGRDWFEVWVDIAYNSGLMEGRNGGLFRPSENLKISEALKLVAMMDGRAAQRTVPAPRSGQPWYDGYLQYCLKQEILLEGEFADFERPITRAELALLFSRTALFQSSADLNDLSRIKRSIPDVRAGDYAASAIFGLYAKGVITGSDSALTFRPSAIITRAEVAAIAARMVRPEQRVTFQLSTVYYRSGDLSDTAEQRR